MKSLRAKIISIFILVIITLASLIIIYTYQTTKENYTATLTHNLKNINITVVDLIRPYLIQEKVDSLRKFVNTLGTQINTRITIVDTLGKVLADSKSDPTKMENHYNRAEIHDVIVNKKNISILRHSNTLNKDMLYVSLPVMQGGRMLGVSRVAIFLKDIDNLNSRIIDDIIYLTILTIIITIVIIIIITNNITKPLKELAIASRKIALGDFDVKIKIKTKDEISLLGLYFNQMTEKLNKIFDELRLQKDSYTTLISSIKEGLMVVDLNGTVMLTNKAFDNIFPENRIHGHSFLGLSDCVELRDFIEESLSSKQALKKEININSNYYLCSCNLIESMTEMIFILYNINDIRILDQLKKDFIVNVSHELRTPLTAIKGYIETLEDEAETESATSKYLSIIRRHTDRLIYIVQDLLSLSELENSKYSLQISKTDVRIICSNVLQLLETKSSIKNLKLILQIEEGFPKIKIDPFKMEQVFINLIDNSIKYTDSGFVKLSIYQKDEFAFFEVSDSGFGIPVEHHSRIFERFYTVDKSRTKKMGGTGLGLSIVKHIILLHKGDIYIDPKYISGTKFIIRISMKYLK